MTYKIQCLDAADWRDIGPHGHGDDASPLKRQAAQLNHYGPPWYRVCYASGVVLHQPFPAIDSPGNSEETAPRP